jgi:hypothetical protein
LSDEPRFSIIGYSTRRLLFVVFAERHGDVVRIISARRPTPSEGKRMKNKKDNKPKKLAEEVEVIVTEEDYEAGLKRGWTDDDMLKPGRYKFKRGGFLKRHPELKIEERKSA